MALVLGWPSNADNRTAGQHEHPESEIVIDEKPIARRLADFAVDLDHGVRTDPGRRGDCGGLDQPSLRASGAGGASGAGFLQVQFFCNFFFGADDGSRKVRFTGKKNPQKLMQKLPSVSL